jgi:hypothetical protein
MKTAKIEIAEEKTGNMIQESCRGGLLSLAPGGRGLKIPWLLKIT